MSYQMGGTNGFENEILKGHLPSQQNDGSLSRKARTNFPQDERVDILHQTPSHSLNSHGGEAGNFPPAAKRSTHPALASHAVSWQQIFTPIPAPGSAGVFENKGSKPGAFLINDNIAAREPIRTEKSRCKQTLFRPLTKKKKSGTSAKASPSVRRGNGFSQSETESLLELLEEHEPLSKDEWEKVTRLHELRYPQQRRNADSIRRKFSALCRSVPPTGDPNIPSEVLKAKEIRKAMTERADIGEGEESNDEYTEEMQEETLPFSRAGTPGTLGSNSNATPSMEQEHAAPSSEHVLPQRDSSSQPAKQLPRPLVREQTDKIRNAEDSMISAIRASMLQEQMRRDAEYHQRMMDREEEKERRAEERLAREEERKEERECRAEDRKRNEQMTQMMMLAILGPRARDFLNDTRAPNNSD